MNVISYYVVADLETIYRMEVAYQHTSRVTQSAGQPQHTKSMIANHQHTSRTTRSTHQPNTIAKYIPAHMQGNGNRAIPPTHINTTAKIS